MPLYSKITLGILTPIERLTDIQLEPAPVQPKRVKEVETQKQSSQTLPDWIQALADEAKVVITVQQV